MGNITIKNLDGTKQVSPLTKTGDTAILATAGTFMTDDVVIYAEDIGIDPSDATADAQKILAGYTAYIADRSKVTGTIQQYNGQMLGNKIFLDAFREMSNIYDLYVITSTQLDLQPNAEDLHYTGRWQHVVLHDYIPSFMSVTGSTGATEKGTYTTIVEAPEGFIFKSTGTTTCEVQWSIID